VVLVQSVCDQKILVFVLQMEKSKQSTTWMGWGRIALLRKGESPALPGEEREEEAEGTVGAVGVCQQTVCFSFYTTLSEGRFRRFPPNNELSGEEHGCLPAWWGWSVPYTGTLHEPRTFLLLACFFSTSRQYSKKFFFGGVCEGRSSIFGSCFELTRGCRPYL
jgi:hypothetical protein